ncbi:MAG: PilX N-terminal domain-containing pilus assembly protein [Betaproteobacteria bacterium]|jgi:Tfp pilus assembly protein PilX
MTRHTDRRVAGFAGWRRRGFVLPVVLVMLVVMTTVVLFSIRRATVDARLAGNDSRRTINDTSAEYVLRYCELWTATSLPGETARSGYWLPPVVIDAPAATATAAWRVAANWNDSSVSIHEDLRGPNIERGECLIENASAELVSAGGANSPHPSGNEPATDGGSGPGDSPDLFRKFRVTARAVGPAAGGNRVTHAQSEVRLHVAR